MNRIFRKVWNKALGQWVVASELATADKAGAQSASAIAAPRRHGLTVALGALMLAMSAPAAFAQSVEVGGSAECVVWNSGVAIDQCLIDGSANASGANAVAIGAQSTASGNRSSALGTGSSATATGATAIGADSSARGANSIALGRQTSITAVNGVAIGYTAFASNGANGVAIGFNSGVSGARRWNISAVSSAPVRSASVKKKATGTTRL
jgi:hypothetical protein